MRVGFGFRRWAPSTLRVSPPVRPWQDQGRLAGQGYAFVAHPQADGPGKTPSAAAGADIPQGLAAAYPETVAERGTLLLGHGHRGRMIEPHNMLAAVLIILATCSRLSSHRHT